MGNNPACQDNNFMAIFLHVVEKNAASLVSGQREPSD